MDYEHYMTKALQQAETALAAGEFPVGCVMVYEDEIIATGARESTTGDRTNEIDHAEMVALKKLNNLETDINLGKVALFSTLEPCLMCFGALLISNIGKIVFAYEDAMGGGTQCDLSKLPPLYKQNQISIIPNILRKKSLQLLKTFFSNPKNTYLKDSFLATYTLRQ
ncbi:MAG: nucleoside deaminase [Desulfobacterales bacterium]|jgi:tRNA(adenine34) deaminase